MKTYLQLEEIVRLEHAAHNSRDRLLIRLLFRLGCRVSEALALAEDDIDFTNCTVTIKHLKRRTHLLCPRCKARLGKVFRFCPGCGDEISEALSKALEHRRLRVLPIDRDTAGILEIYIRKGHAVWRQGRKMLFGINRHRAWQIVRGCAGKAGLPKLINPETGRVRLVSPHRLRDAFAVHAMKLDDSGDGLRLLQEHLGHASFNTTAKYRKVAGEEHRGWYEKLWEQQAHE